jgi:hypothetical protein
MGEVVRFPTRLRPIQPITAEQVEIRDALILTMGEKPVCPDCAGTGWNFRHRNLLVNHAAGYEAHLCPCGVDPICPDEPDFDGAA